MAEETERVVGAFDDEREAERAEADLGGADLDDERDAEVAFAPTAERGDSAERPPDTTVAVEVPADRAEAVAEELRDEGAEEVEVEEPAPRHDASGFPQADQP